jgi:hypothetical protein
MSQPRQLIVPGRFESLTAIAAFITQAAREAGLDDDEVFHVEMAVMRPAPTLSSMLMPPRLAISIWPALTPRLDRLRW